MIKPVLPHGVCLILALVAGTAAADGVSSKSASRAAPSGQTNKPTDVDAQGDSRMVREAVSVARQLRKSDNVYDQVAAAGLLLTS